MPGFSEADANMLFSPWVLRAAWNKVRSWGETAVWLDPAELLAWEANPWGELWRLAALLREDNWRPAPFPLVPYPKKGDQTRHFCQPSVRDQVAFAVFMVLLGPFLEARMPNVSFGNRLFRPRVLMRPSRDSSKKDEKDDGARWFRAPYSLGHDRVYESFPSGYGLFRRLLQWSTNDGLLGGAQCDGSDDDERDSEDPDLLPYFRKRRGEGPWSGSAERGRHLYYLRVDLSTTYPAINRQALGGTLRDMLGDDAALAGRLPSESGRWGLPTVGSPKGKPGIWHPEGSKSPFPGWLETPRKGLGDHPWRRLANNVALRVSLAEQLCVALDGVEYAPWTEPADWTNDALPVPPPQRRETEGAEKELKSYDTAGIWRPSCSIPPEVLASQRFGLPTGLIIGGLLCNVALAPLDWHFCRLYEDACRDDAPRLLFLRFVDDIVLLSERPEPLFEAVRQMQGLLGDHPHLKINVEKTRPEEYGALVRSAIEGKAAPSQTEFHQLPRLTRASADLFTTEMVREMSELGEEALDERYGGPGLERTEKLLNLLGRGDGDEEVADAARLSFALGRLAQASWPTGPVARGDRSDLTQEQREQLILHSAERAVRSHPARTQLWRPTLILALRTDEVGWRMLTEQILPLIAWSVPPAEDDPRAWDTWEGRKPAEPDLLTTSPVDQQDADAVVERRVQNRRLRASWHRAAFWRHWLAVLLELRRRVNPSSGRGPRSGTWLSHLDVDAAKKALARMEDLASWLRVLYPEEKLGSHYWGSDGPFLWWWEAEALRSAMLALTLPSDDLLTWLGPPARGRLRDVLGVPPGLPVSLDGHAVLLAALYRTLGPRDMRSEEPAGPTTTGHGSIPEVWQARLKSPERKTDEMVAGDLRSEAVRGPDHVRTAAQLTRVLSPDRLPLGWSGLTRPLPRPATEGDLPDDWRRVLKLDVYHQYRKTLLALGHLPTWGNFEGWFTDSDIGEWPEANAGEATTDLQHTLLALPGDLPNWEGESRPPMHPAFCPELGVPPAVSSWIVRALEHRLSPATETESQEKFNPEGPDDWEESALRHFLLRGMTGPLIAPETVRLTANATQILRSQRVWSVARDLSEESRAWDLLPSGNSGVNHTRDEYGARLAERIMDELKQPQSNRERAWVASITPLRSEDPAPHPMFLFGRCFLDLFAGGNPDRWSLSALMLWLLTGGEHELDRLFEVAPWQPAVFDRQLLRSRLLLPLNTWAWIEEGFGGEAPFFGLTGGAPITVEPVIDLPDAGSVFNVRLALDRYDVVFSSDGTWQVPTLTAGVAGQAGEPAQGGPLSTALYTDLRVRLVQPVEAPKLRRWMDGESPSPSPLIDDTVVFREPLRELCEHLQELRLRSRLRAHAKQADQEERNHKGQVAKQHSRGPDDLSLFPEWYVPHFEAPALLQFVKETHVGIIAGLSPRELPRMTRTTASNWRTGLRVLVNEALVALPTSAASHTGAGRGVHAFWVRKPYPNADEQGLALHLTATTNTPWRFQRGLTWTRFRLPTWGGFTVAICSDILDTFAWDWLRGRIQHLFVVAYNTDLDLFDKMTWTRAYELFANVAMSNHGRHGGTLSWTPKHGHHKQLFEVKGPMKGVAVTVELPIKELMERQRIGTSDAAKDRMKVWKAIHETKEKSKKEKRRKEDTNEEKQERTSFKSPPPGYRPKDD